jgi:hypothetical protein
LDQSVYEEVEHDTNATTEAAIVVIATALLAGIGGLTGGVIGLIVGVIGALIGWAVYAYFAYIIGTKVFAGPETSATWGEVARGLGYAQAPRALLVLGVIPVLGIIVALVVFVWVILTTLAALRAALDFGTWRAAGTAIVAVLAQAIVIGVIAAIFAGL